MAVYLKTISWRRNAVRPQVYPFALPLFQSSDFELMLTSPVTILVGENGTGKSTLLEAIASNAGFSLQGGSRNHRYGEYDNAPVKRLESQLRFAWSKRVGRGFFFRAESFFNFSNYLDQLAEESEAKATYAPYGGKSLLEQSHGEAFLSFFANRLPTPSFYILDEPEAALSPQRQLTLMEIIYSLAILGDAQIIIATHSPLLSAMPFADLRAIQNGAIKETKYNKTEHYKTYRRFIEAPETLFRHMFGAN